MNVVIVSRHHAAVEFIRQHAEQDMSSVPVIMDRDATADDVRGKIVYGNIPMHLAALAAKCCAIEFSGTPPRGREYTLQDMLAAGASISCYVVKKVDQPLF